jgi:hypothetical protein
MQYAAAAPAGKTRRSGTPPCFSINAYGAGVRVESADRALLRELKEDFSFFSASPGAACAIKIIAHPAPHPQDLLKGARRVFGTSKWTIFRTAAGTRAVSYPEGLLCEYDYAWKTGELWSSSPALLREICYLLILSRLGEELERKGLHRVHALAAEFGGEGFLVTAPMGAGKTTLFLELARDPAFTLLANDTPLADHSGYIHPFPLRVGLSGDSPQLSRFSKEALRPFDRRHYPRKYLLAHPGLSSNAPAKTRCTRLFLLERGAGAPLITAAGGTRMALELLKALILGSGVPQIAEYFLRPEASDLPAKAGFLLGRCAAAAALLRNSGAFRFRLSTDPELNAAELKRFLSRTRSAGR